MKANIRTLMAAVTLAAGLAAAPMALAQADLQRQQLEKQEQERKREQRAANQETRAERREAKHEREELSNMPKPVRQTLRSETQNAKNIDYYRVEGQAGTKAAGREFGAKFTATNGHQMDVRVDRQGKVLWSHTVDNYPVSCHRLANGNTFIATYGELCEVSRDGKKVYSHKKPGSIYCAQKLRNDNILYATSGGAIVEMEPSGKQVHSLAVDGL